MKTELIINTPTELLVIVPQLLGFRPKNRLIVSAIFCVQEAQIGRDGDLQYCDYSSGDKSYRCSRCDNQLRHAIGPILAVDIEKTASQSFEEYLGDVFSSIQISVVSIDWYADSLFGAAHSAHVLATISRVRRFFLEKMRVENPIEGRYSSVPALRPDAGCITLRSNLSELNQSFAKKKLMYPNSLMVEGQDVQNRKNWDSANNGSWVGDPKSEEVCTSRKKQLNSSTRHCAPEVIAHLCDYKNWISESDFARGEKEKVWSSPKVLGEKDGEPNVGELNQEEKLDAFRRCLSSYLSLEQQSDVHRFIELGSPSLSAENQLITPRVARPRALVQYSQKLNMVPSSVRDGLLVWQEYLGAPDLNSEFGLVTKQDFHEVKNLRVLGAMLQSSELIQVRDAILIFAVSANVQALDKIDVLDGDNYLRQASKALPEIPKIRQVLAKLAAIAKYSDLDQSALYAAMAYLHWWIEQPAAAMENARYALEDNPNYSLAKLIVKVIETQVVPPWRKYVSAENI